MGCKGKILELGYFRYNSPPDKNLNNKNVLTATKFIPASQAPHFKHENLIVSLMIGFS